MEFVDSMAAVRDATNRQGPKGIGGFHGKPPGRASWTWCSAVAMPTRGETYPTHYAARRPGLRSRVVSQVVVGATGAEINPWIRSRPMVGSNHSRSVVSRISPRSLRKFLGAVTTQARRSPVDFGPSVVDDDAAVSATPANVRWLVWVTEVCQRTRHRHGSRRRRFRTGNVAVSDWIE